MRKFLSAFNRIKEKTFLGFESLASFLIFFIMILIGIDVFGRALFNKPFQGTPEIISVSIVIIAFLELPHVLLKDKHIRVTIFYDKAGPVSKDIMDFVASVFGMIIFYLLITSSLKHFYRAIEIGEFVGEGALRVPTAPGRAVMLIGSVFMILQFFCNACAKIASLINRIRQRRNVP